MNALDRAGHRLTSSREAVAAYADGVERLLRLERGAVEAFARAVALDPTFALAHAALALAGHDLCAPVDVASRLRAARLHARRSSARERSHVHAVDRHVHGDPAPLVGHLADHPDDAVLLSLAVPTIAFAGVTTVPQDAWRIVERCAPAYGEDWWFTGLLAFVRQEQGRYDEAMTLSCRSLAAEPRAGHSAHARTHAYYETADHRAGLSWIDRWIDGPGAGADSLLHFSWHAAMHELSDGDLDAVRRRYDAQLRPTPTAQCRGLVDAGSLLWRWALTPGATDVPGVEEVLAHVDDRLLTAPPTAFAAMHAAVVLCAAGDAPGLVRLAAACGGSGDPARAEVAAPLALALRRMVAGDVSGAADDLARLTPTLWRVGGSEAQREVVEETRICALLRAGRHAEAVTLVDARLDRRRCRRDEWFRTSALADASLTQRGSRRP